MSTEPLLSVRDLCVVFETPHGEVKAVDRVSFQVAAGETLGLVGESGSGKTVTSLALMRLIPSPPGRIEQGDVRFKRMNLLHLPEKDMRRIRGAEMSMIFQDPMTSLNPLLTIGRQLTEVLEAHKAATRREMGPMATSALGDVGIPNPERVVHSYPHELSGGMRQRVMIAMALLCEPDLVFADEPTTALDVTIQAQILELMREQQEKRGMAIVLITHDLGVVAGMADRVNVMYGGKLVETSRTGPLFQDPLHPYTRGLLDSVPTLVGETGGRLATIDGQPPDLSDLPPGCAFAERCGHVKKRCREEEPRLVGVPGIGPQRRSACFEAESFVPKKLNIT